MLCDELLQRYPIISDQIETAELRTLLKSLESLLDRNVAGDIVEFGCYSGTTSLFISRLLKMREEQRSFHVYDSFIGLPDKTPEDQSPAGEQFRAGELSASKQTFIQNYKKAGLTLPIIHKGWFSELSAADIPSSIAFAFLDGDYFASINTSLRLIEDRLSAGAVIIVDDYQSEALPGARKAVDRWLKNKDYALEVAHSLAVIRLP